MLQNLSKEGEGTSWDEKQKEPWGRILTEMVCKEALLCQDHGSLYKDSSACHAYKFEQLTGSLILDSSYEDPRWSAMPPIGRKCKEN